jgi:hypothetical protein
MHPHTRGVAFLLSIGTLPLACKDPPGDETGGTSTGQADTTSTSNPTTGDPPAPATTDDGTSTTTTTGPSTDPPETAFLTTNTTTGDPDSDSDFPPIPPPEDPVCQGYLDHLNECYPRYPEYNAYYAAYCDYLLDGGLAADGRACREAIEGYFVCFNAVPCGTFDDQTCDKEMANAFQSCPNFFPDEPSTDTDMTGGDTESTSTGTDTDTSSTG